MRRTLLFGTLRARWAAPLGGPGRPRRRAGDESRTPWSENARAGRGPRAKAGHRRFRAGPAPLSGGHAARRNRLAGLAEDRRLAAPADQHRPLEDGVRLRLYAPSA